MLKIGFQFTVNSTTRNKAAVGQGEGVKNGEGEGEGKGKGGEGSPPPPPQLFARLEQERLQYRLILNNI